MFQNILVPLDGSQRAEQAIPVAARLARASGGTVLLVEIVRALAEFEIGATPLTTWAPAAKTLERKQAAKYLEGIAASDDLAGVATETGVYAGPAAAMLLLVAQTRQTDLIVMTTRGLTGLARWALGSVAEKVAQESSIPVLLLHEHDSPGLPSSWQAGPFSALVALDGSEFSEAALLPTARVVGALAAPEMGNLHLVRVLEMVDAATMEEEEVVQPDALQTAQEWALQQAKDYLAATATRMREMNDIPSLNVSWSVVVNPQFGRYESDVASAILRAAEDGEPVKGATAPTRCSLVAMATHGRSGLSHWVLGSVTQRVLRTSMLPMLIVRPRASITNED